MDQLTRTGISMTRTSVSLAAMATMMAAASAARAQPQPGVPDQEPPAGTTSVAPTEEPDDIVVLGTRRAGRTSTDSASPIDVISSDELQAQPAVNMLDTVK